MEIVIRGQKRWARNAPYLRGSRVLALGQLQMVFTAWRDVFCAPLPELDPGFIFFASTAGTIFVISRIREFYLGKGTAVRVFSPLKP